MMSVTPKPTITVVGAGPAGLAAAEAAAVGGARVKIYERMPSPARKFLLAGRGGLNLTHGEPYESFVARYGPAASRLRPCFDAFPPDALRAWSLDLGEPTFVGSSGRVFPHSFKASPLLRAWLRRLEALGVIMQTRHTWTGWHPDGGLVFETPRGEMIFRSDAVVLAVGGASWPRLGSDGRWTAILAKAGVGLKPFRPSNCGFIVDWPAFFRDRFEGQPLKGVAITFGGRTARGDVVITRAGLEGGPVYHLSPALREAIERNAAATVTLAFRPDMTDAELRRRLGRRLSSQSTATQLRKAFNLPPVAVALLRGFGGPLTTSDLALLVNRLPLTLLAPGSIVNAISTAGGVDLDETDQEFMLVRRPGVFVAGEMLDWEAPTGGYLLQACFSTGRRAASGALRFVGLAAAGARPD